MASPAPPGDPPGCPAATVRRSLARALPAPPQPGRAAALAVMRPLVKTCCCLWLRHCCQHAPAVGGSPAGGGWLLFGGWSVVCCPRAPRPVPAALAGVGWRPFAARVGWRTANPAAAHPPQAWRSQSCCPRNLTPPATRAPPPCAAAAAPSGRWSSRLAGRHRCSAVPGGCPASELARCWPPFRGQVIVYRVIAASGIAAGAQRPS